MSTTIGSLDVKLNLELQRLDGQIKQANAKVAAMGKRMNSDISKAARSINTALGTLGVGVGVGALVQFGREIIRLGSVTSDLATQANVSVEAFQVLAAAGRDAGVGSEQITQAFVRLGAAVQDAADGNKVAVEWFAKLNLTAAGLKALAPEDQFELLARRIQQATDREQAFNAVLEILGAKTAPKLREVLQRLGVEGFESLRQAAKGQIISDEQIKALDDFGDKLERIAMYLKVIGAKAGLGAISVAQGIANSPGFKNPAAFAPGIVVPTAPPTAVFPQIGDPLSGRAATPEQIAGAIREANQTATMKAAESAERAKQLAASQAATRARLAKDDIALQQKLAESYGKVGEAVGKQGEELAAYIEKVKDTRGELKEWLDEEAKIAALIEQGLLTREEGGRYLSDLQSPDGDPSGTKAILTDAEKFEGEMVRIFESVGESASRTFADMVISGENALDSLTDMVARAMLEMVARMAIINPLLNAVFGGTKGFEMLPTLFSAFGGGRASGGDVHAGRFYRVGEEGEELFAPSTSGRIIPNHQLNGGGYAEAVTINNYVQAGVSRAELIPALNATSEATIARIRDMDRRRK